MSWLGPQPLKISGQAHLWPLTGLRATRVDGLRTQSLTGSWPCGQFTKRLPASLKQQGKSIKVPGSTSVLGRGYSSVAQHPPVESEVLSSILGTKRKHSKCTGGLGSSISNYRNGILQAMLGNPTASKQGSQDSSDHAFA